MTFLRFERAFIRLSKKDSATDSAAELVSGVAQRILGKYRKFRRIREENGVQILENPRS